MQEQPIAGEAKEGDILVIVASKPAQCADCGTDLPPGSFLRPEGKDVVCLDCGDLDRLEFLPRGDAALTRRAAKHSPLRAVVIQWSRHRKRYERQGTLVDSAALRRAEAECAADAPERAARRATAAVRREADDREYLKDFAAAVRRQFPGCPPNDEATIAAHACLKYSGRVGRSAAAKDLDATAVRLAVVAHIRHVHTEYDRLLNAGVERRQARERIAETVGRVLARWGSPG